ncbi:MAG TPA: homocysteine S-methyltransferase family protein [Labilithrix sp.]
MERTTILDGPMGTELAARGVATPLPAWSAHALEVAPDVVRAIHADYARGGAEVHRTCTFRTQPRIQGGRFRELVATAVRLAREGASGRIAGSLAPIEDCYRPDLAPPADVARPLHRAMAEALRDAGVDLVVCETFPHAGEAAIAVEEAARTGLETWIALTAGPDGSLMTPEAMERAARDCVAAGATYALVCCTGVSHTTSYVSRLARIGVPFGAYANAGDPREGFGWGAPGAAERYAEAADAWRADGATVIGSCCGTSPAHIAALQGRFGARLG